MSENKPSKFRNVIFCDDVRDEMGNKKSLMGVVAGDLQVGEFPATIGFACYFEYFADADDGDSLKLEFRLLQDDAEIAKGGMQANIAATKRAHFVLPKGLVRFETPATFRMMISVNGQPEEEVLAKKIMMGPAF